jgi:hypothetical protein
MSLELNRGSTKASPALAAGRLDAVRPDVSSNTNEIANRVNRMKWKLQIS